MPALAEKRHYGLLEVPTLRGNRGPRGSESVLFDSSLTILSTQARELATAQLRDRHLIQELHMRNVARGPLPTTNWGKGDMTFRNKELAMLAEPPGRYFASKVSYIEKELTDHGTLDIHLIPGHKVIVPGGSEKGEDVLLVSATPAETHGDMSEKVWIRDQTRAGKSRFEAWLYKRILGLNPEEYEEDGRIAHDILMSTMHLMSTEPQVGDRFEAIIKNPDKAKDFRKLPQIAMKIDEEHLGSKKETPWRMAQDAWQMLGITLLDAMANGLIKPDELLEGNKRYLAAMMPFLAAIDFTTFESSGPWEERMSVMTSVIGVETRLLHKIKQNANGPAFAFLAEGFEKMREYMPDNLRGKSFEAALDSMIDKGLTKIGQQLPFESPGYPEDSIKYREADASLLNLLDYDIPALLAEHETPLHCEQCGGNHALGERQIEDMILKQVDSLIDPVTHWSRRYGEEGKKHGRDTYLGPGYNLNETLIRINGEGGLKQSLDTESNGIPPNLDKKAEIREQIVPDGEAAAWGIPPAQKGAWAARKLLNLLISKGQGFAIDLDDIRRYDLIAGTELNNVLAGVTGNEVQPVLNGKGFCELKEVDPWQIPECWWRLVPNGDHNDIVPSPNIPLNWIVGLTSELVEIYTLAQYKKEDLALAS